MTGIEGFFKVPLDGAAESARRRHEAGKERFETARLEARVRFEEEQARPNRERAEVEARQDAAHKRIERARGNR